VKSWGLCWARRGTLAAIASVLVLLASAAVAGAQTASTKGYDISYPQCGSSYPGDQTFAILGVTGGLANDANGCLRSELKWASRSRGLTTPSQAPVSFYINTANPGPSVADWPHSGSDAYGTCRGKWSRACAYLYGHERAARAYGLVGSAHQDLASIAPWWLDIETVNSWADSSTHGYRRLNIAAIRGFIEGLIDSGAPAPVGVYSTRQEWRQLTGLTSRSTAAAFGFSPPSWVSSVGTLTDARINCTAAGFTGVSPTLTQYGHDEFDGDLRCR
jgi:hypothetical protein